MHVYLNQALESCHSMQHENITDFTYRTTDKFVCRTRLDDEFHHSLKRVNDETSKDENTGSESR